jgi:flagellar motility protein MotE (MotC chaperone)
MMKRLVQYRLVPIVLIAVGCLLVLKASGLFFDGGYTLGQRLQRGDSNIVVTLPSSTSTQLRSQTTPLDPVRPHPSGSKSWMQEMFGYPGGDVTGSVAVTRAQQDANIITGAAGASKPKTETAAQVQPPETKPAGAPPAAAPAPGTVSMDPARPASAAERAILERLHQRRQELDARARELDVRENLIKAAEKKMEARLLELKETEARINAGLQKKDDAEAARFKAVVTMYETMKPKDAAKIFDRLDAKVLLDVSGQINPRRMSEILAQMSPEAAERLTVELASRPNGDKTQNPNDLPKIDGKPGGT